MSKRQCAKSLFGYAKLAIGTTSRKVPITYPTKQVQLPTLRILIRTQTTSPQTQPIWSPTSLVSSTTRRSKAPSSASNARSRGINGAFYRLANQTCWKLFRESNFQPSDFLTYSQSRYIYKLESKEEIESNFQKIHHEPQVTPKELQSQRVVEHQPRRQESNALRTEREELQLTRPASRAIKVQNFV